MKLTAVTLYLHGRRYSAFVMLPADKPVVTEAMQAYITTEPTDSAKGEQP